MTQDTRLWGARFRSGPDEALMTLSRGDASHFRLAPFDIVASQAHARELGRAGLLTNAERDAIVSTLDTLRAGVAAGDLLPAPGDEDVHTFMERLLVERLGDVGAKLRAGRSRNDQAANNLKLYLRVEARRLVQELLALQQALIGQAEAHMTTIAPGFTHLQAAQPVLFAHQLLAHAQGFSRDVSRLMDWDRRNARSPLGAAALAGSAIVTSPELSAAELGYDSPCENSIDAVGSRDHVAEFLFAAAMLGVNLSRLCEEVTLWSSYQFSWVRLDDSFSTGSSIMPQKKNPDIAELTRGRAARLIGAMNTMLIALKGLPLAYNRDLAEDKHTTFDAIDALHKILPAMAGMIRTMKVDAARVRHDAGKGFTLATEVADWLARQGVPFATAHEITGALVKYCEEQGKDLESLTTDDLARVDPRLGEGVLAQLTLESAIEPRSGYGGTATAQVSMQISRLRHVVHTQSVWAASYDGPMAKRS